MNRQIIIIVSLTSAIILAIGLVFPKKGDSDSLDRKVKEKEAELQSREVYFASLEKTSLELQKYPTQLAKISSALPKNSQFPALFDFLQKASSQTGLVLMNVVPSLTGRPSAEVEGANENTVTLVLTGTYPAFRDFLRLLEESSRLIEVENISFSQKEKASEFNLKIKGYSY